ncbi:MAG: GDP-mannose 4,6-dehydratase [Methanophagales archaeon]|nr:GDP-mannose 4,6-dehydratase [Methanophagales archaeon]
MSLKNKSVLVSGGAGFIGSHLVDRIVKEEPEKLVVVDNFFLGRKSNLEEAKRKYPNLKIYDQDATDYERMSLIMKEEAIEAVFNLAIVPLPVSLEKPKWTYEHNIAISSSYCELLRNDFFKTLINFSSSEAYGTYICATMDESHSLNPMTPYAASKASVDHLVLSYCRTFGIDAAIVRPFNNFGPRQNDKSYAAVIPLTIRRILSGEAPVIYWDGEQSRDFIFVTDTADGAIEVYNHKNTRGKVLNIASGKDTTINTVVKTITKLLNCDKPIVYKEKRPGDVRRHIANTFLARDLLNFKPKISFEEGMKLTVEWYKNSYK